MIRRVERELREDERLRVQRMMGDAARMTAQSEEFLRAASRGRTFVLPIVVLALAIAAITMMFRAGRIGGMYTLSTLVCTLLEAWAVWSMWTTLGLRRTLAQSARGARTAAALRDAQVLRATEVTFTIRKAWNLLVGEADPNCDMWVILYELEDGSLVLTHMPGVVDLQESAGSSMEVGAHASILVLEHGDSVIAAPWGGPRVAMRNLTGFDKSAFSAWHQATERAMYDKQRTPGHGFLLHCQRTNLPAWVQSRLDADAS